ncbi:MAG: PleD family two-component system response regulator [Granulosicoccus sp.]
MTTSDRVLGSSQRESTQNPDLESGARSGTNVSPGGRAPDSVHVLLVDDSATVRESAGASLRAQGYSVVLASNGFEALARVVQKRPDVVFADSSMPGLDGYQMCALIKSNSDYRHIPVIMLTGRDGLFDQTRAALVGSDVHVSRPFTANALSAAVSKVGYRLSVEQRSSESVQAFPASDDTPD